jgi:hypothetical protein
MNNGISIEIGGVEITGSYPGIGKAESHKIVIIFDKYFPYDDGNGNPIYDENTGAELRDPVTGEPK